MNFLLVCLFFVILLVSDAAKVSSRFSNQKYSGIPLYDYIDKVDPEFSWSNTGMTLSGDHWTGMVLNVTSLRWRNENEVSRSLWWHYMVLIYPNEKPTDLKNSFMYLTDGSNDKALNEKSFELLMVGSMAVQMGCVGAVLFDIPNQPITFAGFPEDKSEDRLIGRSWMNYALDLDNPDKIAYFPMAKAGVRGLTVAQAAFKQYYNLDIQQFYLSGASKRAATVWLVTAYEAYYAKTKKTRTRLIGSAPLVFDALNFAKSVPRMYQIYNGWSIAFAPYALEGVTSIIDTPLLARLAEHIDASSDNYRKDVAEQDILVINSTGDEFFVLDNDSQWLHLFMGTGPTDPLSHTTKMRRNMIPNAEHVLFTNLEDIIKGITGHFAGLRNQTVTYTSWEVNNEVLTMYTDVEPIHAEVLHATTIASEPNRRDFRLVKGNIEGGCLSPAFPLDAKTCANPVLWEKTHIAVTYNQNQKLYEASVPLLAPESGWTGYFIRMHYRDGQMYTTQVKIAPDTLPFPPCVGDGCIGPVV